MRLFIAALTFCWMNLFVIQSFAQTCRQSSKYTNCNEDMPKDLEIFQSDRCKSQGIGPGKACLNAYDQWFESDLKATRPAEYQKYMDAMRLQDGGDSQACIRYLNGVFKRPREAFLERTAQLSEFIKATAQYYGIPPEAIVCAIGGDATTTSGSYMDQSRYDDANMIQALPVAEANAGLRNFALSNPPAPANVKGPAINQNEMQSIRNAALILRHDLETYKAAGFSSADLSPEILASIYHMGAYRGSPRQNWAEKTKSEGRKPGMSFIGLFCARFKEVPFRYKLGL